MDMLLEELRPALGRFAEVFTEAFSGVSAMWDDIKGIVFDWPTYETFKSCPAVPKRLLHLAFHAKTKRKRNKNYSRVLKLWEEYNARNDTEQS